ncbi:MAG: type II toxin-antitoxin system VapC family toxin [Caulobacteraceae bacterium]|nr:type II toxin-antitoxin system VapC family toxin [Caulobacteraceae bacterium]
MFVDTSAIVALIAGEPEARALAERLERADVRRTSPLVRLETCAVLTTRLDISPAQAEALFEELLSETGIVVEPITDAVGRLAVSCFARYGKGRHPARLNIVDCFSYAGAKGAGETLLFKGEDFTRTDIEDGREGG